jgi:hypothetical protein
MNRLTSDFCVSGKGKNMRTLNKLEVASVSGSGTASEILKWVIGEIVGAVLKAGAGRVGVAGSTSPANENDHGGTSYGIGPCNAGGCGFGALFPDKVPPLMFVTAYENAHGSQPTADDWRAALTEYKKWTPDDVDATREA